MCTLLLLGNHGAFIFASIKILEDFDQLSDTSCESVVSTKITNKSVKQVQILS